MFHIKAISEQVLWFFPFCQTLLIRLAIWGLYPICVKVQLSPSCKFVLGQSCPSQDKHFVQQSCLKFTWLQNIIFIDIFWEDGNIVKTNVNVTGDCMGSILAFDALCRSSEPSRQDTDNILDADFTGSFNISSIFLLFVF